MKKNNQVQVLEPEVEEIPLEQVIDTTLVKHNVTESVIASLKERFSGMQLKSLDDKEGYLDIKEARKEVRKVGILTEKICKHGREDAIKTQKLWLSKEKEILEKIAEVEEPLNVELEKFESEVERKENEEKKRQEEQYIKRQSTLSRMGATYDNGSFVLNHISYEIDLIKAADEDMWGDTILPKYKKEFEANETVKVTEENKRKEEIEKAKREREEFELQQAEFKKQQELFAQQQGELQSQKDEVERHQRLEQERKDAEVRAQRDAKVNNRIDQLISLGLNYNAQYSAYVFKDVNIDVMTELKLWNDEEWNAAIEKITPVIAERKKEEEEKQATIIEQQKQDAIKKALRDAELKKAQEEQDRQDQLYLSNDKTKWQSFIASLNSIAHSEMKSPKYRKMQAIAKEKIEEIISL